LSYLSLTTTARLAEGHHLKIIDVEKLTIHAGSLRAYLTHAAATARPTSPRVADLLEEERATGLTDIKTYADFSEQAHRAKRSLLSFLIAAKEQGKSICGYGAGGNANTLLNYCGIGSDFLDFVVDHNPHMLGRFVPGTHVPIKPIEAIDAVKPDVVLVLEQDLSDEIARQMRHIGDWGGEFVVPIPKVRVIAPIRSAS
jgi:hypothetical protein